MNDVDILEFVPIILAFGGIVMAFAAYNVGQSRGYKAGKTLNESIVTALEREAAAHRGTIEVLHRTVAAYKDQIEAQERLIEDCWRRALEENGGKIYE